MLEEEAEAKGLDTFTPHLAKIRSAGKHLLELINAVLDSKMDLYLETFAVDKMLNEIAAIVKPFGPQEI